LSQPLGQEPARRKIWGLHPNVFFLGVVSLLTDTSSEMIFTLVPLFVFNVLNASAVAVGLIGGLSESTDAIFRIFSGRISDKMKQRKLLAVLGYGFSTVVKPFMLLATTWGGVLGVRFGDRVGKGIRSSPRDALIADSVAPGERGKSFGVHRAMDTTGAFLGLVVAAIIIYTIQGGGLDLSRQSYHWLVIGGIIPAILAVLVLLAFVREKRKAASVPPLKTPAPTAVINAFSTRFKLYLLVMAIFTLGNSSDFFVILRAQNLGTSALYVTLMLVLFNTTYVAVSIPAGVLSDRLGRKKLIALGWAIYALVYLGFAVSTNIWNIWVLFACYGVYYGIVEGVARAFVADLVPAERRGTAYGYYHGVVGLCLLPASVLAGWLWDAVSPSTPFYLGAGLALLAMILLMAILQEHRLPNPA
jgi:MFS family permease